MTPRVAILADHLEEGWTSMDHYAAMLTEHVGGAGRFAATIVRPPFVERFGRVPGILGARNARTLDRYWNRYSDYPRAVARERGYELFHVVDQTYAHVASRLPARRTVVTCHDLDFADPPPGTRHAWLVRATGRVSLPGLARAGRVLCDSDAIRTELLRRRLVEPRRVLVVPLGVEEEFRADGPAPSPRAERRLMRLGAGPRILHVGAMVARKRIDLLLRTFAATRRELPEATLVRAGGELSEPMLALARELGVERSIVSLPFLSRAELAAVYRRSDLFLLCSQTEGFALPVLEAMASGLPVVSRDLPAVRELSGDAIRLVPGEDPEALAAAAVSVLRDADARWSMRERGLQRAEGFRWTRTAELTANVYAELLDELAARPPS